MASAAEFGARSAAGTFAASSRCFWGLRRSASRKVWVRRWRRHVLCNGVAGARPSPSSSTQAFGGSLPSDEMGSAMSISVDSGLIGQRATEWRTIPKAERRHATPKAGPGSGVTRPHQPNAESALPGRSGNTWLRERSSRADSRRPFEPPLGTQTSTLTRRNVAVMRVRWGSELRLCARNRASSSWLSACSRPLWVAASNAFIVGP